MAIKPKQNQSTEKPKMSGDQKSSLIVVWKKTPEKKTTVKKTTKKTPPKKKYDWIALKQEFFESEFDDVAPFIRQIIGQDTANNKWVAEKVKWWRDEKKKIQEEAKQKALEDFKKNLKKRWDHVFDMLDQAHVTWLTDLANMIMDQWKLRKRKIVRTYRDPETKEITWSETFDIDDITPTLWQAELINILKHIKLEKWEPTDIMDTQGKSKARAWLDDLKKQKAESKAPKKGE